MVRPNVLNFTKTFQIILTTILLSIICNTSNAQTLNGQWYKSSDKWDKSEAPASADIFNHEVIDKLPRTGGQFLYAGNFKIKSADRYVIDFAHSTYIGLFEHLVYDANGSLLATFKGGIQSKASNPYPIRHGRTIFLEEGSYKLVINLSSPFFISSPMPFVEQELNYLKAIKKGNMIAYIGVGIFIAMGIFYLCFAISRRSTSDLAYTVFISGNLIFNLMALNIAPDLFGIHYFQLAANTIFISNIAYIYFVRSLLKIDRTTDESLYLLGNVIIGLFVVLAILGFIFDNWALEICRVSVAIFLGYGLFVGLTYAQQKVTLAYYYLLANLCFLTLATITLWPEGFDVFTSPTLYSAHMGIMAVATEVLLLGLVQAYKINQMNTERLLALDKAEHSQKAARTDALTGAPNRNAFEEAFSELSESHSFTYIDLDGLKYYNDNFGHHKGDDLLREFSMLLMNHLDTDARFFRIAGDEFGIISSVEGAENVGNTIDHAVELLKARGFTLCGASYGQANYTEADSSFNLKKIADARMYSAKSRKKQLAAKKQ